MEERESFMSHDYFEVTLHSEMSGYQTSVSMNSTFQPASNIKPEAPSNLTVARNSSGYRFTWSSNYESHPYESFENNLRYQLLYHRTGSPDEGTVVHPLGKTQHIDDVHLETDTQYTAVVSSHPGPGYRGQWSEWSPPVHWRTKAIPMRGLGALRFLWNVALPVCVVVGILLCFVFTPTARLKVKVWPVIPTPAPYFQPLFKSYSGNFRSWLLSQGGPGEPLKAEEAEKIETVTEAWPLRGEETRPPSPAWRPAPSPAPYVTAGNEVWCAGGPAPCPAQGDRPDTPLSVSLIEVGLAEIFGSRSLGLVLAGEGEWESEDPTPGLDWELENLMPNLDWGPQNPTPDLDGEPKNPILSLDGCWPREPLTALPKGLCAHQDYCTLSGPHNELVPGAALRPTGTGVDKDHGSGSSHNALGPQAELDDVES
ncbi:interleukin-21 receptor-like [Anguilla anguilla]|uniref:interleukin-21 receptor-like n=1 Tax=Anguilla anguilla TaxID=7936 RepID=UPI0015B21CCC|nr:interleukin-21 receptor-like [Anguilla anguilla]